MAKATRQDAETALRVLALSGLTPTQKDTASLILRDWHAAGRGAEFETSHDALASLRALDKPASDTLPAGAPIQDLDLVRDLKLFARVLWGGAGGETGVWIFGTAV